MDRRRFVVALSVGLVAAPGSARAQARKSARIGWVGAWYSPSAAASLFDAFRQGMRELGYVEGQNLSIDARWMERITPDEAARLTAELVRSKVDVLVAQGPAVPGVKAAAGSMPVVWATASYELEDTAYNLAAVYAMMKRRDEMFCYLRSLVIDGKWRGYIRQRPEYFANYWEDPEFRTLVGLARTESA